MAKERVGFIGLGIMGSSMALHLRRAGYELAVWARREEQMAPLVAEGARRCASPAEVGQHSDILCINVTDTEAIFAVLFGEQGAVSGMAPGSLVAIFSTIEPAKARTIGARLAEKSIALVDAPVTGGDVGARNGTLTLMVGGQPEAVARLREISPCFSKRFFHVGELGKGESLKAANQIAVAIGIAAMTEALVFASREGIDPALAIEVLSGGAAGSWAFQNYAPRLVQGNDAPGFKAEDMLKDLHIALQTAQIADTALPVTELLEERFRDLVAKYPKQVGNHALHRLYGGVKR